MKLVLTVLARDEADVIDAQIGYHLNAGVDFVIATDNGSHDGTTEILERTNATGPPPDSRAGRGPPPGRVGDAHGAARGRASGADWVINTDADEFWWPRGAILKEVLAACPSVTGSVKEFWRPFVHGPTTARTSPSG